MKERLSKAYQLAEEAANKAREKQKQMYDTKVRGANISIGDKVFVRILAFDGKHKLSDKWEEEPYTVTTQPNTDIPVYTVRKENGTRTLHRNLLLPFGFIYDKEIPLHQSTKDNVQHSLKKQDKTEEGSDSDTTSEDESDSENHFIVDSDGYLDSDRIITEEPLDPDVDETQLEDNNREAVDTTDPHGDAHTATQAEQEESVQIESAPVEESDGQQEDTPEADISLESDDSDSVPVRR